MNNTLDQSAKMEMGSQLLLDPEFFKRLPKDFSLLWGIPTLARRGTQETAALGPLILANSGVRQNPCTISDPQLLSREAGEKVGDHSACRSRSGVILRSGSQQLSG